MIWSLLNGKWPWAVFHIFDSPAERLRTINIGHFPTIDMIAKSKLFDRHGYLQKECGATLCATYPVNAITNNRGKGAEKGSSCWSQLLKGKEDVRGSSFFQKPLSEKQRENSVETHVVQKKSIGSFLKHRSWVCNV